MSDNKQPWVVPIVVAIVSAVSAIAVAWINKPQQSVLPDASPSPIGEEELLQVHLRQSLHNHTQVCLPVQTFYLLRPTALTSYY